MRLMGWFGLIRGGWSCGNTTRVRHYTNRKGSNGIKQEGIIKAKDNGRDYIETVVPTENLKWIKNPAYHTKELTIKSDVVLNNAKLYQRKWYVKRK